MSLSGKAVADGDASESLTASFERVRGATLALCEHLETEDYVVQSMPDVSPTRWHLAHVTWFFEKFVLEAADQHYQRVSDDYHFLFNSYYYSAGEMHARPRRGLLTRPTVAEILDYRRRVDTAMLELLASGVSDEMAAIVRLGINHEQQHQELLLTDIKHVFSCNPLKPAVNPALHEAPVADAVAIEFLDGTSGIQQIGADGDGFCFDNETPRHATLLHPHQIANRLVTNGEFLEFVRDGGYRNSDLWLSDGWATVNERGWERPFYWNEDLDGEFTLGGERSLNMSAPVAHVSYYEADAFARWAGCRLPTEGEWEVSARDSQQDGNFAESGYWQPIPAAGPQFFGDVWEWTSSSYSPYPGFRPLAGSLGEYNGKFMCNQMTVRGGSCVTASDHIRASYRSFFYPDAQWQFLGFRLARDMQS